MDFDFSGATFDQVQLSGGHFHGSVSFTDALFTGLQRRSDARNYGWISFNDCIFDGEISFFQARFHDCIVSFDGTQFRSGNVHFGGATFKNFNLFFRRARFAGSEIYFGGNEFDCEPKRENLGNVWFDEAEFESSEVIFNGVAMRGSTNMVFEDAILSGGTLDLSGIQLPKGGANKLPRIIVNPAKTAPDVLKLPSPMPRNFICTA